LLSAHSIHTAYSELAKTRDRSVLAAFGISSSDNETESDQESCVSDKEQDYFPLDEEDLVLVIDTTDSSDSNENPEEWASLTTVSDARFLEKVKKQRKYFKDKASRKAIRKIAEERILKRQISKSTSSILTRHPDIGLLIELEVKAAGVGADKWRSTGALTWERKKVGQKITF
jgi:hypothetical protein